MPPRRLRVLRLIERCTRLIRTGAQAAQMLHTQSPSGRRAWFLESVGAHVIEVDAESQRI